MAKKETCFQRKLSLVMRENRNLPPKQRFAKSAAIARRHCGLKQFKGGKSKS